MDSVWHFIVAEIWDKHSCCDRETTRCPLHSAPWHIRLYSTPQVSVEKYQTVSGQNIASPSKPQAMEQKPQRPCPLFQSLSSPILLELFHFIKLPILSLFCGQLVVEKHLCVTFKKPCFFSCFFDKLYRSEILWRCASELWKKAKEKWVGWENLRCLPATNGLDESIRN